MLHALFTGHDHLKQEIILTEIEPGKPPVRYREEKDFYLSTDEVKQVQVNAAFPVLPIPMATPIY